MRRKFPEYGYLYFGDYANCPYGNKSPEEIQELTIAGVKKLFV
jgi:glutamate racemase